jgi:hypothetical protein
MEREIIRSSPRLDHGNRQEREVNEHSQFAPKSPSACIFSRQLDHHRRPLWARSCRRPEFASRQKRTRTSKFK